MFVTMCSYHKPLTTMHEQSTVTFILQITKLHSCSDIYFCNCSEGRLYPHHWLALMWLYQLQTVVPVSATVLFWNLPIYVAMHYSHVTWISWKSLETQLSIPQLVQTNNKENMRAPHYWPFVRGIHQWWQCNWYLAHLSWWQLCTQWKVVPLIFCIPKKLSCFLYFFYQIRY